MANFGRRQLAVYVLASLTLAYVRTQIEYGGWTSWWSAANSVLIHGMGLGLFVMAVGAMIGRWHGWLLPKTEPEPSIEAITVYMAVAVIVGSLIVFFLASTEPTEPIDLN